MSLRLKFAAALAVLSVSATVAVGLASYLSLRQRLFTEVDSSLVRALVELNRPRPRDFEGGGRDPLRRIPGALSVQVFDSDGGIVASYGAEVGSAALLEPIIDGDVGEMKVTTEVDGEEYRVVAARMSSDDSIASVARSTDEMDAVLAGSRRSTLRLVLLVGVVGSAIGWLVAATVTRRLRSLTGVAEHVAATGDLDVDIEATGSDESGRLGASLASMLVSLRLSRDAQRQLVQDAGHELRTPLTSMRTNITLLQRRDRLSSEMQDEVLADLDAEARELTHLVNEIVELATDSRSDEPVGTVSLAAVARRVAERTQRRSGCQVDIVGDDGVVVGREASLERAVTNLVHNAVKFGGGHDVTVDVRAGRVTVLDRGPGLASGVESAVFERFFRADDARGLPGSGLGLSIVKRVVDEHGGTVFANNRPDGGAAIGFEVPADATVDS